MISIQMVPDITEDIKCLSFYVSKAWLKKKIKTYVGDSFGLLLIIQIFNQSINLYFENENDIKL